MTTITCSGVDKRFGATSVLSRVDFTVADKSVTAVVGASGSGKTTLLRLIAGFERADAGTITVGDVVVDDGHHVVRPEHRGIGYVPQEGALFPHLTVARNIAFGVPKAERGHVGDLLDLVGLTGLDRRYPHQLSGGQQQRVALARALAVKPSVVLLDEPFGSLDASLRVGLGRDVIRVLNTSGTTAVLVTHDQDEALALADQVAVLTGGRIQASADPRSLYHDPPTLDIATSIGDTNILPGRVEGDVASTCLGPVPVQRDRAGGVDGDATVLLRPEQLRLHTDARPGSIPAVVREVQFHGHDALVRITLTGDSGQEAGGRLLVRAPGDLVLSPGRPVWVEVVGTGKVWAAGR